MYQITVQLVGFVGTGIMFLSYQCKDSGKLFLMQMLSNIAYILHFFMLGAFSGSLNLLVSLLRNFVLIFPCMVLEFWFSMFCVIFYTEQNYNLYRLSKSKNKYTGEFLWN